MRLDNTFERCPPACWGELHSCTCKDREQECLSSSFPKSFSFRVIPEIFRRESILVFLWIPATDMQT